MAVAVGLALATVCLMVLLMPFRRRGIVALRTEDPIAELLREREHIYEEVRGLRHDFDLGHVPEEEYRRRLEDHRLRAATMLQQQERLEDRERQLEEDILALGDPQGQE